MRSGGVCLQIAILFFCRMVTRASRVETSLSTIESQTKSKQNKSFNDKKEESNIKYRS